MEALARMISKMMVSLTELKKSHTKFDFFSLLDFAIIKVTHLRSYCPKRNLLEDVAQLRRGAEMIQSFILYHIGMKYKTVF